MRRFIHHSELARDSRFVRQDNAQATVLSQLPDDVAAVVEVFDRFAPMIERSVKGTDAEPLFEAYGPGFALVTLNEPLRPGDPAAVTRLKLRMHGIYVGELQALEGAGRSLWDFPDAPWEFKMNMARQCWDEARHVQIYEKLLGHVGGALGEFPENTFLYETSCVEDPVLRVAGVNRCLEGLACDAFRSLIEYGRAQNDEILEQAVDFVLADELTHVRFGSDWVKEFTRDDPERAQRAADFQRETDTRFSFGTRELAREERIEAGFTEEELRQLDEILDQGPRRKTLVEAALILKERHQQRQRGEAVAPY
jgi:uncharacterized ferritin-like protein (DUF455 family)